MLLANKLMMMMMMMVVSPISQSSELLNIGDLSQRK